MEYRRLGHYGLKVSEFSLGAWVTFGGQVGEDVARECIMAAYEAGVNFFDNADVYAGGNAEIVMGNVIKDIKRSDLVILVRFSGRPARVRTIAAYRASTSWSRAMPHSNGWVRIISTSIFAIATTRKCRSKRWCG